MAKIGFRVPNGLIRSMSPIRWNAVNLFILINL